jgi:RND family efflux transporter MFP subunit
VLISAAALAEGPITALPSLKVVKVKAVQSTTKESVSGSLFPSKLLPMGFEVGGRLASSKVSKGDQVKAGQTLGALDTEIADAQVAQAEAGVAAAEAGAGLALDVAGRNEKLKAEGSVSDVQFKSADVQSKQAAAQVLLAKAQLAQARAGRRRHEIKALFAGTVIDAPDNTGGMVGPGTPVYIIMQLDPLVLKATVPESMRQVLKPGLKVRVEAVGASAFTDDAVVKVLVPSADPQTRRVPIEIIVPNADGRFTANTLARVTLPVGGSQSSVVVPATALASLGGDHVFSVDAAGLIKRIPVVVVERRTGELVVTPAESVKEVVDYPTDALVDGTKVTAR